MAAQVARPEHAFIGNHTYRIEWLDQGEFTRQTDRTDADGVTWDARSLILICLYADAPESHYQEVLVHELLHGVWGSVKLTQVADDLEDGVEEKVLLQQSPGLLFLLKQNPHVVKYLVSDGNHVR